MIAKVKLSLQERTVPGKVELGRTILLKMTGNANFPTPLPDLGILKLAIDACEAAYNAAQTGGKQQTAELKAAEEKLDAILTQMAMYVGNRANGDEVVILSAGMNLRRTPEAADLPLPPENVKAVNAQVEKTLNLAWDQTKYARAFVVEQNDDANMPEAGWKQIAIQTQRKLKVTDLNSGNKYGFRVKAMGVAGVSGYSTPVVIRVL